MPANFVQGTGLALLTAYGSGDEGSSASSDEEQQEQAPPQRRKSNFACRYFARGKCFKGDACPFRHEERPRTGAANAKASNSVAAALSQLKQNRRPLLKMVRLLENDIKREKSALLQSIRYIVQRNFFLDGDKSDDDGEPVTADAATERPPVEEQADVEEDTLDYGYGEGSDDEEGEIVG
ncbi:hypothetical protein HDV00_009833 [Rhizophlyctis rosea]|nr:hypothetical protein HDV00_009833 [Rhizophlyctis rosea]